MKNILFIEGDTDIATMFCGACGKKFRAHYTSVTTADKRPICSKCIEYFQPLREEYGLPPMPYIKSAYLKG